MRVSESTKRELESFGNSGDSHENIIKKLIKLAKNTETKLIRNKNIIGTKYGKSNKTFNIETEKHKHFVVCKFNDLSLMNLLRNKNLQESFTREWEIDLEIVNVKYKKIWENPNILKKEISTNTF